MNNTQQAFLISTLFAFTCPNAIASKHISVDSNLNITVKDLSYSGGADSMPSGQIISGGWAGTADEDHVFQCEDDPACNASYMSPVSPPLQLQATLDGVIYDVFPTGVDGIGYIAGVKDHQAKKYTPLLTQTTQIFPAEGTPIDSSYLGFSGQITFVKTNDHLVTGRYSIPEQNIANLWATNYDGETGPYAYFHLKGGTDINVTASSCSITSASEPTVSLGDIPSNDLPSVGTVASTGGSATITLNCDKNIHVYATISDQTNLSNQTDTLMLSADSTASGVGIQAFFNESSIPLLLGPDSSSQGTINQFHIQDTTQDHQILQVPLLFKYVRTADISAGSANGLAGIIFSYQ